MKSTNYWQYINPISLLTLIIFSFGIQLSNVAREIFIIFILFGFIYKNKLNIVTIKVNYFNPMLMLFVFHSLITLFHQFPKLTLQFLGFGYDNAFHLTVFRGYRSTNWFPNVDSALWWTDFELFKRTPTASSAVYSLISNAGIGSNNLPLMEMSVYVAINIIVLFSIVYVSVKFVSSNTCKNNHYLISYLLFAGISTVILSTSGVMLVNGFPPYLLVTLILTYWMHFNFRNESIKSRLISLSMAAYSIILITPGPVLFLFLPGLYLLVVSTVDLIRTKKAIEFLKNLIMPVLLATLSLTTFKDTSGSFGWRQILAPGGVHKPNLFIAFLIFSLFMVFFLFLLRAKKIDIFWLMAFSGGLSVAAFSFLTYKFTGSIQYYAVKQLYIWLPVGGILMFKYLNSPENLLRKIPNLLTVFLISTSIIVSFFYVDRSESGYMGTLPTAILSLESRETWKNSIVNSDGHIQTFLLLDAKQRGCRIYRLNPEESDLNSRWANALSNPINMTESCFGGYWNSSKLSIVELIDKLGNSRGNFLLVLPLDQDMKYPKSIFPANVQVIFN